MIAIAYSTSKADHGVQSVAEWKRNDEIGFHDSTFIAVCQACGWH